MDALLLRTGVRVRAGVVLIILCTVISVQAQSIDEYVNKQLAARRIPAISVAVVRNGQVMVAKGYGVANVELGTPATENTVFQLASLTKQFTATAIMLLVEDGKLGLDDKLSSRVPELPAAWSGVTIRQLLNHTSGIKNLTDVKDFDKTIQQDLTQAEVLHLVADAPLDFPSGTKFSYSNTGYILLGMVIEKVSGKSYGDFMRERIFQPLGMTATRFNNRNDVVKNRAAGYLWEGETMRNANFVSPSQAFSAGALVSTAADMARWDIALGGEKLLGRKVLDSMFTPGKLADGSATKYGFGWGVDERKGHRMISHGGAIDGFSTYITRLVNDKLTVIVLCNLDGPHAQRIAQGIVEIYLPDLADPVAVAINDTAPEITAKLKAFLIRAAAGEFDRGDFTPEAQGTYFPDRVLQLKSFLGSLGSVKSFELVENEMRGEDRWRRYRYTGETGKALIGFALNKDQKIVGIGIRPE